MEKLTADKWLKWLSLKMFLITISHFVGPGLLGLQATSSALDKSPYSSPNSFFELHLTIMSQITTEI